MVEIDKSINFSGRLPGQDPYGRWLVMLWVRDYTGHWVNVNKALLAKGLACLDVSAENPPGTFIRRGLTAFAARPELAEGVLGWHEPGWAKAVDDRDEVLGPIRLPDGSLDPRLLRIGDVQFEVPPENITVTKRLASKKVPLIRAKSSTMKGTGHAETMVEFTLYFTTLEQVNGRPRKVKLPSGEEVTYHVNGLRALVSQFKKCPFLPVQNHFLNNVHNIDALTLSELQVSTMPGFPGVLMARLVCFAFDYTGYINADDFNAVFNWPLFRYYYQRSLTRRDGSSIYLAPIRELSNDFTFYVISEEELAKRK
ncbi:MAG: hypothetical protein H5U03_06330, partial [Clostridia bacterium]|nr:hypothetical protein [Clostridia bacterium]